MGYTEYFPQRRSFTDAEWDSIVGKVNQVTDWAETKNIRMDDDEGSLTRMLNRDKIWFNGIGDEAHETFVLCKKIGNMRHGDHDFYQFCKTAEKPYTVVVQLVLMIVNEVAPNVTDISSDGKWDNEWLGARDAYKEIFGVVPENML